MSVAINKCTHCSIHYYSAIKIKQNEKMLGKYHVPVLYIAEWIKVRKCCH